jgi:primosomal protein N' (replication factor Y) (superfamily II helicase)
MVQQNLFQIDEAPWETDDQSEKVVATLVFPTGPDKTFDYEVSEELRGEIEVGRRVRAPFGRGDRPAVGYCVALASRNDLQRRLKTVAAVVDRRRLLTPAMLRLTEWLAERYLCTRGQALEAVLPAVVREQETTRTLTLLSVPKPIADGLDKLPLPPKQAAILKYLAEQSTPLTAKQLCRAVKCTIGPISALRKKNLLEVETRIVEAETAERRPQREMPLVLNADQTAALAAILKPLGERRHQTVLIHGVTGSGKTEVYMQAIDEVIRFGRQAIVLVPEISLTPQTRERFRSRFDSVAVLHSHLRDAERHWHWDRIVRGEVQVVVGARSAVFAPTPHLGLIVLDEEHETTFKQDSAPRYHTREVALWRAEQEKVPLILGSATPSLESWYRAAQGEYQLIDMPRRVSNRPLPDVGVIDLRDEFRDRQSRGAIGRQLHRAIDLALKDNGQVILLLNRRGYSTHIQCPACGTVLRCPHCELSLTHHLEGELAICHYCEYQTAAPAKCPECTFAGIRYSGVGTQRLEAEVRSRFPSARILRMDTDAMRKPGSHQRALDAFRRGNIDILLGTQMIAKGLDFPNVVLVGVVNADIALHFPDFRAAERTFQLVTQVAGRTGRGERGGRVLVQTFSPDHPAIKAAVRHDYPAFASQELPVRDLLHYPPYSAMARVIVRGQGETAAEQFAEHLAERLKHELDRRRGDEQPPHRVLGPAPAPIPRLRGMFRFHFQAQCADGDILRAALREATTDLETPDGLQWSVDIDPVDML